MAPQIPLPRHGPQGPAPQGSQIGAHYCPHSKHGVPQLPPPPPCQRPRVAGPASLSGAAPPGPGPPRRRTPHEPGGGARGCYPWSLVSALPGMAPCSHTAPRSLPWGHGAPVPQPPATGTWCRPSQVHPRARCPGLRPRLGVAVAPHSAQLQLQGARGESRTDPRLRLRRGQLQSHGGRRRHPLRGRYPIPAGARTGPTAGGPRTAPPRPRGLHVPPPSLASSGWGSPALPHSKTPCPCRSSMAPGTHPPKPAAVHAGGGHPLLAARPRRAHCCGPSSNEGWRQLGPRPGSPPGAGVGAAGAVPRQLEQSRARAGGSSASHAQSIKETVTSPAGYK